MIGTRQRMAISWARRIFLIVSGHHDPAFTVASFATTTTGRPCTMPIPVTTPAPGACPSYWSYATRRPSSRKRSPESQRRVTRSRAVSFPCECCFSIFSAPPPSRRRSSSARSSVLSSRRRLVLTRRSRFLLRLLGEPRLDVAHEVGGGRAGSEQRARPHRVQGVHVLPRDDAPTRHEDVAAALRAEQLEHAREERHVGPAQDREADDVDVLLNGGGG